MNNNQYAFSDISDGASWILREHVEDFVEKYPTKLPQGYTGRVFNTLVDGLTVPRRRYITERPLPDGSWIYRPLNTIDGIELVNRAEIGIDRYPRTLNLHGRDNLCASFAVRACSVIEAYDQIIETLDTKRAHVASVDIFIDNLSQRLL